MPSRDRSFRVEAVVLRHSDYGEADRLLVLYTRESGKVRAIAKGARKIRSRKAGHLEPFTRVSLQLAQGRDMPIVTQAETVDAYLPLRENLIKTSYAAYLVEVIDRFFYEEGENRGVYRLLTETLERISTQPDPVLAIRYFEIQLLDQLGFRPELFTCLGCGEPVQPQDQFFSFEQGGVFCPKCGQGRPDVVPVSVETLKYLRHLQRSNYPEAARAQLTPVVRAEMEALLQGYMAYFLERSLNTPTFLRQVRQSRGPAPEA
jgi:DNA repair protein RecO (recombination protein O)